LCYYIVMSENLTIVAIGGGVSKPMLETAVEVSGVDKPNVLIIPTARPTEMAHNQSIANFGGYFSNELGLNVESLHEFYTFPSTSELEEKIEEADLVYISGGDTDAMMRVWALHGIDEMLAKRARGGLTISGVSAGAIAPFVWGHSDSLSYKSPEYSGWQFMSVGGLGLINAGITPHYDSIPDGHTENRSSQFHKMFSEEYRSWNTQTGFGIDNSAGVLVKDGYLSSISSMPENGVTMLSVDQNGEIVFNRLLNEEKIALDSLLRIK
jgi:dipeptidase E